MDKEWQKLEKIPAWQLTKVRNQKEVIDEARRRKTCGKVQADAEPGFENCCKLFNSAEFECIKPSRDTYRTSSQSLSLVASVGRPAAEDSNPNDAVSGSQVWQSDAKTNESVRRLAATGTNHNLVFQASARPNNYHICRAYVPHLEKFYSNCD